MEYAVPAGLFLGILLFFAGLSSILGGGGESVEARMARYAGPASGQVAADAADKTKKKAKRKKDRKEVDPFATLSADGNSIQILIYNHVNDFNTSTWETMSQATTLVSLSVNDLPFAPTRVLHYVVDHTRSNSHTVWSAMGKPLAPSADQWTTLRDASELCYYETAAGGGNSWTVMFPQNTYSVSLIELRR